MGLYPTDLFKRLHQNLQEQILSVAPTFNAPYFKSMATVAFGYISKVGNAFVQSHVIRLPYKADAE